jgi:hypothetical protein
MIFKPPAGDPEEPSPGRPERKASGIAARVEAAAKHRAPAPKGKGIVMLLLGAAVIAALIWDFTGRGAAGRAIRESVDDGERPVAKDAPTEPDTPRAADPKDDDLIDVEVKEGASLSMSPLDAAAFVGSAPAEERPVLRRRVLAALVDPAGGTGHRARHALEAAAWLAREADEESGGTLAQLTLKAYPALEDDRTAYAAILFLAALLERGGVVSPVGGAALDGVILDAKRPLHLRIAAARIRPAAGRPQRVEALASDPATHPALREALGE